MNSNAANWFVDRHVDEERADKTAFREAWQGTTIDRPAGIF